MFSIRTNFFGNVISAVGKFNPDSPIPFSWIDDSIIINLCKSLFFSSLWYVCFLSTVVVVIDPDSVAFWNLISFFVKIVTTCSVSLSTWTCNLLGFVARLLLLGSLVGYFVDFKITLSKGLFQHSTLLLMATTNYVVVNFLAIWDMSLLSELFWCSS